MSKLKIVVLDAGSVGEGVVWPDFSSLGDVQSYEFTRGSQVMERAVDADVLLTNKVYIRREFIEALPKLKYVGTIATGFNQVDIQAAKERGVVVCNVPNYSTPSVAQHTFALMLSLASKIDLHVNAVRAGEWSKSPQFCFWKEPLMELYGKTLGVVGFGDIGQAVARIGNAFGMKVLAYAPRAKAAPEYKPFAFTDLDLLCQQSDVVSLHCPLNDASRHMIDKKRLAQMKPSALLINCSRGGLIQEQDLKEALDTGVIAGAGLDVVEKEPMPDDNPLRLTTNCLITPHIAWAAVEARQRLIDMVFTNLQNYLAGKPSNVVNP